MRGEGLYGVVFLDDGVMVGRGGEGVARVRGGEAGFGRVRGFGRAWGAVGGAALEHPRHKKRA